jgi:hypothetical protein
MDGKLESKQKKLHKCLNLYNENTIFFTIN